MRTVRASYYTNLFSSAGPDLRSVGLWSRQQAMQQSYHLCCHAVGNMATDEGPDGV